MLNNNTQQVFYSWTEFGNIVDDLSEKINDHRKRVDGLTCHDKKSLILACCLCEKLNMTLYVESQPGTLDVALDNLTGQPDVVVTKYESEGELSDLLHSSLYFYETSTIDVEGRKTVIRFPWH